MAKRTSGPGIPKLPPRRPKGVTLSDVHREWQKDQARINPKRIQKLQRKRNKVTSADRRKLKGNIHEKVETKKNRKTFGRFFRFGGGGGSDSPGQPGLKHGKVRKEPKLQ